MAEISSEKEIGALFAGFRNSKVELEFPELGTLSQSLAQGVKDAQSAGGDNFAASGKLQRMFASASIEMWQRAVHSFTVSAGLTLASPIWAAVAGYYSSHYVMRAYAHLLGRFVLYGQKRAIIILHTGAAGFHCEISTKGRSDREHDSYWRMVRECPLFSSDPLLVVPTAGIDKTDSAHRVRANYADHVANASKFRALAMRQMADRIERIATHELNSVPVPNSDIRKFPDLWNVQLIAYHRLVGFREFLDRVLGDDNRFWSGHRSPEWSKGVLDFTRTKPVYIQAN